MTAIVWFIFLWKNCNGIYKFPILFKIFCKKIDSKTLDSLNFGEIDNSKSDIDRPEYDIFAFIPTVVLKLAG
jgi:hypothetical protein